MPTLSIIIPTIGRPILSKILKEIIPQLEAEDEVLVIGDGRQPAAEKMVSGMDSRVLYREFEETPRWGHPQRNWAMQLAKGSHIVSFDDDDALKPDGIRIIRWVATRIPDRPLVFRMQHGPGVLWKERELTCGNVSTQMFVVPNVKERLGRWGDRYEGDLDFIQSTSMLYPEKEQSIVWREEIIALHGCGGNDPRGKPRGAR